VYHVEDTQFFYAFIAYCQLLDIRQIKILFLRILKFIIRICSGCSTTRPISLCLLLL